MCKFGILTATVFSLFLNIGTAFADFSPKVDSLIQLANNAPDSLAAKYNNNVCWKIRNSNPEIAIEYGAKAVDIARKTEDWEQLVKGYSYIGVCHRNLGNYTDALEYYTLGLDAAVKHGVRDQEAYAHVNLANLYIYHKIYDEAETNLNDALLIGKELKDSAVLGYCYLNLGRVYLGREDYVAAELSFNSALSIRRKCKKLNSQCIVVEKYIADCHAETGRLKQARSEYLKCLANMDIVNDFDLLSDINQKLARIYYDEQNYDSALILANASLKYSKSVGSKSAIRIAFNTIGDILYAQKNYLEAATNYANQISYNDSIFSEQLAQQHFNIRFSAEQYKKQMEIDNLAQESKYQETIKTVYLVLLLMGIVLLVYSIWNNKKVRRLNVQLNKHQKQIADSISYAKRIQTALLPNKDELSGKTFSDSFVFYSPRDVVSGDFFWHYDDNDFEILVVADCTGHGVPGAFMSMLGICALHDIVGANERSASAILEKLRYMVKTLLKQSIEDSGPRDGMDIAIIVVDRHTNELEYSGGNIPLFFIREGKLHQLKACHNPIGVYIKESPFQSQRMQLKKGDQIYLSSDGYASQFGGVRGLKLKMGLYKDILMKYHELPMKEQLENIHQEFITWKGSRIQIDDILVVGLQV